MRRRFIIRWVRRTRCQRSISNRLVWRVRSLLKSVSTNPKCQELRSERVGLGVILMGLTWVVCSGQLRPKSKGYRVIALKPCWQKAILVMIRLVKANWKSSTKMSFVEPSHRLRSRRRMGSFKRRLRSTVARRVTTFSWRLIRSSRKRFKVSLCLKPKRWGVVMPTRQEPMLL